ncbi:hypothetical protein ACG7TL_004285 [Trametes sanguinea]
MEYPDEVLPFLNLTLPQLIQRANNHIAGGWVDNLIRLMLAGRSCENGDDIEHRVYVDPISGFDPPTGPDVTLTGDFDSLIGVTAGLPLNVPLAVYPAPPFQLTLRKPVHITLRVPRGDGLSDVPLHKIANVCIGSFGVRGQVRLLFPHATQDDDGPMLTQTDLADLYNIGILRSVVEIIPERRAHWPPSYAAAIARGRDQRGHLHFGSVDIERDKLDDFAATLIEKLQHHLRLKAPHFMIELRGTKGMYTFPVGDVDARTDAFNQLGALIHWQQEEENLSRWYVDIAIEVSRPGHVIQWKRDAHDRLLAYALPSATPRDIAGLLRGTNYEADVSGHLFSLAGFRANPGTRGRADRVVHVNVYTTDKTPFHQLHRGAFRKHVPSDTTPGKIKKLQGDVLAIGAMLARCAGSEGQIQDGTARFEVRVSLANFDNALTDFPDHILEHGLICVPSAIWWDFKYCRVVAIHYLLKEMADYAPAWRAAPVVLQLFAVLVYMLNATLSAPSSHHAESLLATTCAMKVPAPAEDDDDADDPHPDNVVPVGDRQGLYFVCDIVRDRLAKFWRIPNSHRLPIAQLLVLFRSPTLAALAGTMGATGIERFNKGVNKGRTRNRRGYTLDVREVNADAVQPLNLGLADALVAMREPLVLAGPDIDGEAQALIPAADDGPILIAPNENIDYLVERIWAQFAFDLIQISPNNGSRFEPAYATLSSQERLQVTSDLFRRPAIPFSAVWYRFRDQKDWDALFDKLFPPHGHVSYRVQNYNSCLYFQLWQLFGSQTQQAGFEQVRERLRRVFGTLLWQPDAASDRIWVTRPVPDHSGDWTRLINGQPTHDKGVHIVINRTVWSAKGKPQLQLGNAIAFEEEEAEEEEEDDRQRMPPPRRVSQQLDTPHRTISRPFADLPPPGTPSHPASREAAHGRPRRLPPTLPGPTLDSYFTPTTPTTSTAANARSLFSTARPSASLFNRPRNATAGPSGTRHTDSSPSSSSQRSLFNRPQNATAGPSGTRHTDASSSASSSTSMDREAKRRRLLRQESEGSK